MNGLVGENHQKRLQVNMTKTSAEQKYSLLSDKRIRECMKKGTIVIDPFKKDNLGTASYDVSLGGWYFREHTPSPGQVVYSPWSEKDVKRVWGNAIKAEKAGDYLKTIGHKLPEGISKKDRIIPIPPGETFLCHTMEYIGGRDVVTTMMKARSSVGRNFIEVCKCAGWGDVGYINRWTMEITNNSRHFTIPLVVGRRIAQLAFFEVGETLGKDYTIKGKYQVDKDLKKTKKKWVPDNMLPKMWKDREVS